MLQISCFCFPGFIELAETPSALVWVPTFNLTNTESHPVAAT